MTSRRVVDRVGCHLRGVKLGHAGTLDPLATGVLVICVGSATRLIQYVQRMTKTYRTVIRLGASSDTLDADGHVTMLADPRRPTLEELETALASQVGVILQRPPAVSALKVEGHRAYDLARAGRPVELAARPVTIGRIDLVDYEWPRVELEIDCGSGTYIRSIARDLGEALGCGGLVEVLCRTRVGPFTLAEALDVASLSAETIAAQLRPAIEAVAAHPRVALTADQVAAVNQGRALDAADVALPPVISGEVALVGADGALIAIADLDPVAAWLRPRRVLASGQTRSVAGEFSNPDDPDAEP
jgi:tRNA pseudouridine55 synthase